jgi:hypothetical protein
MSERSTREAETLIALMEWYGLMQMVRGGDAPHRWHMLLDAEAKVWALTESLVQVQRAELQQAAYAIHATLTALTDAHERATGAAQQALQQEIDGVVTRLRGIEWLLNQGDEHAAS